MPPDQPLAPSRASPAAVQHLGSSFSLLKLRTDDLSAENARLRAQLARSSSAVEGQKAFHGAELQPAHHPHPPLPVASSAHIPITAVYLPEASHSLGSLERRSR